MSAGVTPMPVTEAATPRHRFFFFLSRRRHSAARAESGFSVVVEMFR